MNITSINLINFHFSWIMMSTRLPSNKTTMTTSASTPSSTQTTIPRPWRRGPSTSRRLGRRRLWPPPKQPTRPTKTTTSCPLPTATTKRPISLKYPPLIRRKRCRQQQRISSRLKPSLSLPRKVPACRLLSHR